MEDYIFLIVASAISVLIGLWNLMIAVLGCFPKLLCTALGSLAKTNTLKNVPLKHGGCIPNLTPSMENSINIPLKKERTNAICFPK